MENVESLKKGIRAFAFASVAGLYTHFSSFAYVSLATEVKTSVEAGIESTKTSIAREFGYQKKVDVSDLKRLADSVAKEFDINPLFFRAVIKQESRWNPFAKSDKGAIGLAQIMPPNAKRCGIPEAMLLDIKENLRCGARILKEELLNYKNPDHALQVYNGGPRCINRCQESINHAKLILSDYVKTSI